MFKHIVMWRFKEGVDGLSSEQAAEKAQALLLSLEGKIPELRNIEVGLDVSGDENSADLVLITSFDSQEALDAYVQHPEHRKIMPFMKSIRAERRVVDFFN